ncbi:hypothetical protein ACJX0J_040825, partial [Zea mays]
LLHRWHLTTGETSLHVGLTASLKYFFVDYFAHGQEKNQTNIAIGQEKRI